MLDIDCVVENGRIRHVGDLKMANNERARESVIIQDPGAVWCDGAIVMSDGSLVEHQFHNRSLVALIRRKIRVERSEFDGGFVTSREISLFVTGRCRRRNSGFSIYWHTHSDLIYVLTGVTYCAQIYVECGSTLLDGKMEMLKEPRVFLVRARDPHAGITHISWSKIPGIWPKDVHIELVTLPANVPEARPPMPISPDIGMVGFPRVHLVGDVTFGTSYVPIIVGDRDMLNTLYSENKFRLDCDTSIFLERASSAYRRLLAVDRELENSVGRRRELLITCSQLATRKRLMLVDGTALINLFATHVCLYGLGEDNVAQEIVGVLSRRKDKGDVTFELHNVALANAIQLALIMRRIQEYSGHLPSVENRLDMSDVMASVAHEFFSGDLDIGLNVISMAVNVLRAFSVRGSIEDAVRTLEGRVPLLGCIDRTDVIKLLKA